VPDWSSRSVLQRQKRLCPVPYAKYDPKQSHHFAYSAASKLKSSIWLCPSLPDILVVKGIRFDVIELLGSLHTLGVIDAENRKRRENNQALVDGRIGQTVHLVANCVLEVNRMLDLKIKEINEYPTKEDIDTITWRLLTCNRDDRSGLAVSDEYAQFYRSFKTLASVLIDSWPSLEITSPRQSTNEMINNCVRFILGVIFFLQIYDTMC